MKKILSILLAVSALVCLAFAASCSGKERTVTFDAAGGQFANGSATMTQTVKRGETVAEPDKPVWEDHVFDGWTLGGKAYDFSSKVKKDITLSAAWHAEDYVGKSFTVTFPSGRGYEIKSETAGGSKVSGGSIVSFELVVDPFYTNTPAVRLNGNVLRGNNGMYSFKVTSDCEITVAGVIEATSAMQGAGTTDDPLRIVQAADLIYIADMVNAGNSAFVTASYSLEADIDLKGRELKVIGDGSTDYSYFGGSFMGNGHTVSNFRIESDSTTTVGFFGNAQSYPGIENSGMIYGLNLDDFEIEATAVPGNSLSVGSIMGFGTGINCYVCKVTNGEINVYADSNYGAIVGGIMGVQQSFTYDNAYYPSEIAYAESSVTVNCNRGFVLAAGGVVGQMTTVDSLCNSFVNNSYANANITGAVNAGGIVGLMDGNCSVTACYASGDIHAQTEIVTDADDENIVFLSNAHSGGVAGYAENECCITDCFATGYISAYAEGGRDHEHVGDIVGGFAEDGSLSAISRAVTVFNCYYAEGGKDGEIDITSPDFLKNTLGWKEEDWDFSGEYPAVNGESNEGVVFEVVFSFGSHTVNGEAEDPFSIPDVYMPYAFYYLGGELADSYTADDGYVSYGVFFDEEHTLKVPMSYVLTRDITLYVGFSDLNAVAGKYLTVVNGETVAVELKSDGTLVYTDGTAESEAGYYYDGEKIYITGARFSRYAAEEINDTTFALADYIAEKDGDTLTVYGGTAYTAEAPLTLKANVGLVAEVYTDGGRYSFLPDLTGNKGGAQFTYSVASGNLNDGTLSLSNGESATVAGGKITQINGSAAKYLDEFEGSWTFSASSLEYYTFDGMGHWTYTAYHYTGAQRSAIANDSGSYTVTDVNGRITATLSGATLPRNQSLIAYFENNALVLDNGSASATLAADAFKGEWYSSEANATLTLDGVVKGVGSGLLEYEQGGVLYPFRLTYTVERGGQVVIYCDSVYYGSFSYNAASDLIEGTFYYIASDAEGNFYLPFSFARKDDYEGEWVTSDDELGTLVFNGFGSYASGRLTGTVQIGDDAVPYALDGRTLKGSFTYNGTEYGIEYDVFGGAFKLTHASEEITASRKDKLGEHYLLEASFSSSSSIHKYVFDGRGEVSTGKLQIIDYLGNVTAEYDYVITDGGATIKKDGAEVGTLTEDGSAYKLNLNGSEISLAVSNEFTGDYGINGNFDGNNVIIGGASADGTINGIYRNRRVTFTIREDGNLEFTTNAGTLYIVRLSRSLAVCSYPDFNLGYNMILAEKDALYGNWTNSMNMTVSFDGTSGSGFVYGSARQTYRDAAVSYTYNFDEEGRYYMWSDEAVGNKYFNYKIVMCEPTKATDVFVSEDGERAFRRVEVDALYLTTAYGENGTEYKFDGLGNVTGSDGTSYTYEITGLDSVLRQYTLTLTDADENTHTAILDFSNASRIILTIQD